ncbi:MAG: hypothetical protein LBL90_12990 [Prevotellaceae bacterium]|jgi:hypothetical protein|nr:hypothetical protein [Prevotellaceae bacterium]
MRQEDITIRPILSTGVSVMEAIMYEAIYHLDSNNPYPKEVIYLPQVCVYWDD